MYLPRTGAIANVVHRDLDLLFKVTNTNNADIWKTVKAIERISIMTFINVDIRLRMRPLRMLYSVTFTTIFKFKDFKLNFSETVRASVKVRAMTFIEVHIRHRMASLRMLYSMTLTYKF